MSLADKAGVVVFSRILTTVVDLTTAVALVRILPKEEFGVISYILVIYTSVRVFATLGFPDSIFYFFERVGVGARRALAFQTAGLLGALALVGAAVMVGVALFAETLLPGWSAENVQAVEQLLPLIALVVLLEVPSWPFDNLMLASDRQVDAAWFQILTSLTRFFGLLGPLWLGYGLVVGMWGLVAYAVTRFVGAFWWTLRVLPPKTEPLPAGFAKEQVRFSVPLGLSSVVGRFNRQVDKIVVSVLLTATALAEYNVGAQEIPLVTVVPAAVASVLISKYVQLERSQERKALIGLWYRGIEKTTLLVVPATVGFIAVAQDFLPTLFGAGYEAAIVPFQIYSLIVLHRVTQYGSILQAFGDTKGILHLTLALLSLNLALSVPLTLWLGLPGAALSTFIANMMSWYLALRKIGRHLDLPAHRVLPFPFYLRVLSVATAVGALVWGTRTYAWSAGLPGIDLAWTAGLYLLLFALAGSTVRIIRSEDWAALRRWLSMRMLRRPTQ